MEALRLCVDRGFKDTGANAMLGFIEVGNKPSVFAACHGGFSIRGKIKNYYTRNGESQDAYILIRER